MKTMKPMIQGMANSQPVIASRVAGFKNGAGVPRPAAGP